MFEKELMINSLRRQQSFLEELRETLQQKNDLEHTDCQRFQSVLKRVETNLKKLRRLRKECVECQKPDLSSFLN